MRIGTTLAVLLALVSVQAEGAYEIAKAPLLTEWGAAMAPDTAWREYPRPQMVRGKWTCLNGLWDYAITSNVEQRAVEIAKGQILVPFAFEAPLSGVGRLVEPHEKMIYTRQIEVHPKAGRRTLLNFEAVDWRASVFVNGVEAMDAPHEGGNLPFSVDITPFVRDGMNELKVVVWDPTHTFINAGGKQDEKTHGCFYTRVSGIWQTVWMEEVPEKYIRGYKVVTDVDASTARFEFDIVGGDDVAVKVDGLPSEQPTLRTTGHVAEVKISNAELWSPENPKLYEFTAKCGEDEIRGYFAMRKIDKAKDAKGHWRFRLNNEFIFPMGTLDQGWWPDGLLTPPSVAACEHDIRTLKDCGFNMMRKHIKVEPRIYYYLCDRIGMMIFQDAPSPAGERNIFDQTKSRQRYGMFRREWKEEVDHLMNHPSIVMWIPYNEGWGQPDREYTDDTLRWTKRYDRTRLVGGPSGWFDFEGGEFIQVNPWKHIRDVGDWESDDPSCDTVDQHNYPGPGQCKNHRNRISLLGEFGGLGLKVAGHLWSEKDAWGYAGTGAVASREANQRHYLELMDGLIPLVGDGLAGTVYTQTTDVEIEINGLMTYDRKVLKYDPCVLREAHKRVMDKASCCSDVLTDYVDPFVGTAGTGHTTPAACVPFGLVQAGPDTGFGDWEHCNGYLYSDKTIFGFTQTHLNGTGCPDLGDLRIMPMPGKESKRGKGAGRPFDKGTEIASPGYYAVTLMDPVVRVEIAAAEHSAIYRFVPEGAGEMRIAVEPKALFSNPPEFPERPKQTLAFDVVRNETGGVIGLSGAYRATCWVTRDVGYCVEFDRAGRCDGVDAYAFDLKVGEALMLKVGLAAGNGGLIETALPERAKKNLETEIPGWDFDAVKNTARQKWNVVLSRAVIEGTDEQKKNWYTSLYHLCVQPNNIADVGSKPFYSTFSCWDTFRAAGPLYTILYPEKAAEFVDSMLEQGERTGYLPIWTLWGEENQCMIGTHSVPMIVDAYLKGTWAGDAESAYAQIKETLTKKHEGRIKENWDLYDQYGYYPFDKIRGESVSRTMECAYDDWCAGVMAEKLGHKEDAAFFFKRSAYWKNVFDPSLGLVRGKDTKGNWREPFDPYALGHGADLDNDFTEGNAFHYSWHVMQDFPGLVTAMGGSEELATKLDALFSAPDKIDGAGCVVDVTGLVGQYVHGNEPSHHVIYFYPQVGHPEKAAERIREVFDKFYLPKPDGLCGNDDCGQMSAWYLFSAMGFYPFNPCGGEYIIGAPQVPKAQVEVGGRERTLTVIARGLSKANKYVKSVALNGKPITDWKIRHEDIVKGGELMFEMEGR